MVRIWNDWIVATGYINDLILIRQQMADQKVTAKVVTGINGPQYQEWIDAVGNLANGVTTVRNMWGSPDILALRRSIEQGNVVGPQIYTTGPLTDGSPPIRPSSRVVENAAQAIDAVTSDQRAGYDAIKVYNRLSPGLC